MNNFPAQLVATRRQAMATAAMAFGSLTLGTAKIQAQGQAANESEISHTAEAIHQEIDFKATPKQIYEALLDSKQFDKVVELSGAVKALHLPAKPCEISNAVGGAFAIFGGFIVGRHVELVLNRRIVQAWREESWKPGIYSMVKFDLLERRLGARLIFDHAAFPQGSAETLASGWKEHYWEPLAKLLA